MGNGMNHNKKVSLVIARDASRPRTSGHCASEQLTGLRGARVADVHPRCQAGPRYREHDVPTAQIMQRRIQLLRWVLPEAKRICGQRCPQSAT